MTAENRKQRLRRLERLFVSFPIYFITACTHKRKALLANQQVHDAFIEFAQEGPAYGAWIGAYVLMPDHVHLFVAMRSRRNFEKRKFLLRHWQKTFFDHVLRSSESYTDKWNYVQQNPVRAGLVRDEKDWPFLGEVFRLEFGPEC